MRFLCVYSREKRSWTGTSGFIVQDHQADVKSPHDEMNCFVTVLWAAKMNKSLYYTFLAHNKEHFYWII